MGYCMQSVDTQFFIDRKHVRDVIATLNSLPKRLGNMSFVDGKVLAEAKFLADCGEEIRWEFVPNNDGDIVDIEFIGEKYGSEDIIFDSIAPYVKHGSYIEMAGEDGESWRWVFKAGKCKSITAQKQFPDDDDGGDIIDGDADMIHDLVGGPRNLMLGGD